MSSITITPRSYAATTTSNLPIINVPTFRPAYLNPNPPPPQIQHTYQNLGRQIQLKPSLYGAGLRKYNDFHKFQIGTTTTFNGYTNITGSRHINLPPIPASRRNLPAPTYNNNNNNHYQGPTNYNRYNYHQQNNNNNVNINNLPSLLDINPFHLPSQHNTRTYHHAQQYHPNQQHQHYPRSLSRTRFHVLSQLPSQSRSRSRSQHRLPPPPIKPRRIHQQQQPQFNRQQYQHQNNNNGNNNNYNNNQNYGHQNNNNYNNNQNYRRPSYNINNNNNNNYNNNNRTFKGLIISDSMCSRVRTYAINKLPLYNVELSYESGCDIIKMINYLQTPEGQRTVGDKQFLVICLGTNDVGQYGVDVTLQRCSDLIRFVRQSFPGIRAISWMALSPRWKPTRFVSAAEIGGLHHQFNERLHVLSKQLDFDVVDARLGPSDMRVEDGLHPSTTTGRWKYEVALREWFSYRAVAHSPSSSIFQDRRPPLPAPRLTTTTTTPAPTPTYASILRTNNNYNNNNNVNNNNSNNNIYNAAPAPLQRQQYHRQINNNNYYQEQQHYNSRRENINRHVSPSSSSYNINNNTQPFIVTTDNIVQQVVRNNSQQPMFPSTSLIKFYPHKLKTKEQFLRDNEPAKELEKEKDKLFLAANIYYQHRYFEEESRKWKIYEKVASRKEQESEKDGDDIVMKDLEEIPQARPFKERFSAILNMTVSDTDSQSNENSNIENKEEASSENSSSSEVDEDDKKKRKLQDTSLSPTSKEKLTSKKENILRKKQTKSKKKKKTSVENDPRAPEGSPVLLVSESSNREQGNKTTKNTRPDTPVSPSAKKRRLFSHTFMPQRMPRTRTQTEVCSPTLPVTPPGLAEPPILSPRQSTPRSPIAPPRPLDSSLLAESIHVVENSNEQPIIEIVENNIAMEEIAPMEQDRIEYSPSVMSKDLDINRIDIFDFPIIPIECQFHFRIFHIAANSENIKAHREFLEKKSKQQEQELEKLMKTFSLDLHTVVVKFIKNSVDTLIDILKNSNQKRLDNLLLDQMREKAVRIIRNKADKDNLDLVEKTQMRLERTLELRFQLDKLDRRLNENMPPPALNMIDKLQFRSRELSNESKEQYSEQWNSIIRKTKLDLTSVMRIAKVAEIDKSDKEHRELVEKIPIEIKKAYKDLEHTIEIRHNRSVQKKLDFLERRARVIIEK